MSATAPAVNQVVLVGNLTADPVLKQLEDDRKVCQLRIAVNDQPGQPMFIDVATFGAQAEACATYLSKGRAVAVTGRLVYREWDETAHAARATTSSAASNSAANPTRPATPTTAASRPATSERHRGADGTCRRRPLATSTRPNGLALRKGSR